MKYQEGTPTSQKNPFDEMIKEYENKWWNTHTKHERYERFEHTIRILPSVLTQNTISTCDNVSNYLKDNHINIEHFFLDYAHFNLNLYNLSVKDEMNETNSTFIQNSKSDIERFLKLCDKIFGKSHENSMIFIRKYIKTYIYKENL